MFTTRKFNLLALVTYISNVLAKNTCIVPGGAADDAPAIKAALATCNNGGTVVLSGKYTLGTVLRTMDLNNVGIQLSGTLTLKPDLAYWTKNAIPLIYQDQYTAWAIGGNNIHIYGGGVYEGSGDAWYAAGTKGVRPIPWTIANATDVLVENIKQTQSPLWHNFVTGCNNVTFNNINLHSIQASGKQAQNTDGWDTYRSSNVKILNSVVVNGDDCVSFKPNSTFITVMNLSCTGSHGISVGSLGQYAGEIDIVANVIAKNITMINSSNGARIKAWGGSSDLHSESGGGTGYVKNITFQDFTMVNVDKPVIIDQCYSTSAEKCAQYPSEIEISDIHYTNVHGSGGKSSAVVWLQCSQVCKDITAAGTKLLGTKGNSEYFCTNIQSLSSLDFPCSEAGTIVPGPGGTTTTKTKKTKTLKIMERTSAPQYRRARWEYAA